MGPELPTPADTTQGPSNLCFGKQQPKFLKLLPFQNINNSNTKDFTYLPDRRMPHESPHRRNFAPAMASPMPEDVDPRVSNMKLLETGNFADAKLICGNKTFKIHKSVVCTRSVWFEKALTGSFEASTPLAFSQVIQKSLTRPGSY